MQIKATNTNQKFNPVQVVITLETPEEFKALYQVSNFSYNVSTEVSKRTGLPKEDINELLKELWQQLDAIHPDGEVK